ncbi:hypothetical protein BCR41DRAFT_388315, partial [Lobosporangium transversale]
MASSFKDRLTKLGRRRSPSDESISEDGPPPIHNTSTTSNAAYSTTPQHPFADHTRLLGTIDPQPTFVSPDVASYNNNNNLTTTLNNTPSFSEQQDTPSSPISSSADIPSSLHTPSNNAALETIPSRSVPMDTILSMGDPSATVYISARSTTVDRSPIGESNTRLSDVRLEIPSEDNNEPVALLPTIPTGAARPNQPKIFENTSPAVQASTSSPGPSSSVALTDLPLPPNSDHTLFEEPSASNLRIDVNPNRDDHRTHTIAAGHSIQNQENSSKTPTADRLITPGTRELSSLNTSPEGITRNTAENDQQQLDEGPYNLAHLIPALEQPSTTTTVTTLTPPIEKRIFAAPVNPLWLPAGAETATNIDNITPVEPQGKIGTIPQPPTTIPPNQDWQCLLEARAVERGWYSITLGVTLSSEFAHESDTLKIEAKQLDYNRRALYTAKNCTTIARIDEIGPIQKETFTRLRLHRQIEINTGGYILLSINMKKNDLS